MQILVSFLHKNTICMSHLSEYANNLVIYLKKPKQQTLSRHRTAVFSQCCLHVFVTSPHSLHALCTVTATDESGSGLQPHELSFKVEIIQ